MTEFETSRNTIFKKQIASINQALFDLNDLDDATSLIVQELIEIHRYHGSQENISQIIEDFKINFNAVKNHFKVEVMNIARALLPDTGESLHPRFNDVDLDVKLSAEYITAPYIEEPKQETPQEQIEG